MPDVEAMTTDPAPKKEDPARAAWLLARRELLIFGVLSIIAIAFTLLG